jgi:hypothetical protein
VHPEDREEGHRNDDGGHERGRYELRDAHGLTSASGACLMRSVPSGCGPLPRDS